MAKTVISVEETEGSFSVVRVQGNIDIHSIHDLKEVSRGAVKRDKPHLLIDMEEVDYVDSAGLGAFLQLVKSTRQFGGKIHLFCVKKEIERIMHLTELNKIIPFFVSEEEAIGGL